jgi:DNA-binding transcriptional regulator GbsR (MarR family)
MGTGDQKVMAYVEQVGIQVEEFGLPRMAGRILGWLLVCTPPHQRSSDVQLALGGSKAAISTSLGLLVRLELVEKIGIPGERSAFYQLRSDSWSQQLERKVLRISRMRELLERGLTVLDGESPERRRRLAEIHDMYVFFEAEWPPLVERWRARAEARKGETR